MNINTLLTVVVTTLVTGFIAFTFWMMQTSISDRRNKKRETEKEKKKQEEERHKAFLGPDGIAPKDVSEAVRIAKSEGRNISLPRSTRGSFIRIFILFFVISATSFFFINSQMASLGNPTKTPILTGVVNNPSPTPTRNAVNIVTITPNSTEDIASTIVLQSIQTNVSIRSTNYDSKVILTLEKIEVLANDRMKWYLSFWNQGDESVSMAFGSDARYTYVADEFDVKYKILSMNPPEFISSSVPAGVKLSGWLELNTPTNGAKSFKLFMERFSFGFQQLRYDDPLEFSLSGPLVP